MLATTLGVLTTLWEHPSYSRRNLTQSMNSSPYRYVVVRVCRWVWMVVRFVCVFRVPVCARVSRTCPVCVPAPPVSYRYKYSTVPVKKTRGGAGTPQWTHGTHGHTDPGTEPTNIIGTVCVMCPGSPRFFREPGTVTQCRYMTVSVPCAPPRVSFYFSPGPDVGQSRSLGRR